MIIRVLGNTLFFIDVGSFYTYDDYEGKRGGKFKIQFGMHAQKNAFFVDL